MMVGDNKTVDQAQREGGDDSNNKKRFFQTSNPHITYRGLQFSTPIQGKEPHTQGGLWDATGTAAYTQESHLMVDYENSRPRRNWGGGQSKLRDPRHDGEKQRCSLVIHGRQEGLL